MKINRIIEKIRCSFETFVSNRQTLEQADVDGVEEDYSDRRPSNKEIAEALSVPGKAVQHRVRMKNVLSNITPMKVMAIKCYSTSHNGHRYTHFFYITYKSYTI